MLKIHNISDEIWYVAGDRSLDVFSSPLLILSISILGTLKELFFLVFMFQQNFS